MNFLRYFHNRDIRVVIEQHKIVYKIPVFEDSFQKVVSWDAKNGFLEIHCSRNSESQNTIQNKFREAK